MPMFHAYCKNSIDHAKLADKVSKSMEKTLKAPLKSRCKFDGYKGSGHYYYFINTIRVISFVELDLDNGNIMPRYSGEYRRDYVYDDEEYNKDIFIDVTYPFSSEYSTTGQEVDIYKKSFFMHVYSERNRYKYDGIYVNQVQRTENALAVMIKAGLKAGDIIKIDNRDCFLFKYVIYERCYCMAIAID